MYKKKEEAVKNRFLSGRRFMILSAVILANPFFGVLDILPDFIAYAFIIYAISDLSLMYSQFEDAKSGFTKLMWLSISRIPFVVLCGWLSENHGSEIMISTAVVLIYGVAELIFAVPAFNSFFAGTEHIADMSGSSCDATDSDKKAGVRTVTVIFLIARSVLSLLPELLYVPVTVDGAPFAGFHFVATVICSVAEAVFAAVFLIYIVSYINSIFASDVICDYIDEQTERESAILSGMRVSRDLFLILNLIAVAVGFGIDLIFDDVNVLPDTVSAFILVVTCVYARKYTDMKSFKVLIVSGTVYAVFSFLSYWMNMRFLKKYDYSAIAISEKAEDEYLRVIAMSLAENAAFLVFMFFVSVFIYRLAVSHTGYDYNDRSTRAIHSAIFRRTVAFYIIAVLCSLSSFAYTLFMSFTKTVPADSAYVAGGSVVLPLFDGFWLVPVFLSLIWLVYSLTFFDRIKAEIHGE